MRCVLCIILLLGLTACDPPQPEFLQTRQYCDGTRAVLFEDDDEEDVILMDQGVYESLVKANQDYDEIKQWHQDRMKDDAEYKANYERIQEVSQRPDCGYTVTGQLSTPSGYTFRYNPGGFHGGK